MRVFIQVVDTKIGIHQSGSIDEPVISGFEIKNALLHFGSEDVDWISEFKIEDNTIKIGKVRETTKIISLIV